MAIYIIGLCIARMVADDGFRATLLGLLRKAEAVVAVAWAVNAPSRL